MNIVAPKISITKVRIVLFLILIFFFPFLRSCEERTLGFPTVSLDPEGGWHLQGVIINALFITFAGFVYIRFLRKKLMQSPYKSGLRFALVYHFIYLIVILWPEIMLSTLLLAIILPGALLATPLTIPISDFFGDPIGNDILFRIYYVLGVLSYFFIGCIFKLIKDRMFQGKK
jgi:hypothetical protein